VLDPRFGGLAYQVDEKHTDTMHRLDLLERELAALRSQVLRLGDELLRLNHERHEEGIALHHEQLAQIHAAIGVHLDRLLSRLAEAELDGALVTARLVEDALRDADRRRS